MLHLHVVQARYGDCLILEYGSSTNPKFILIDGGPGDVYENSLRHILEGIADAGGRLELAILSHVDNDHVLGLLDLMRELERPDGESARGFIGVGRLWHNTFSGTLGHDVETRFRRLMDQAGPARRAMSRTNRTARAIAEGDELTTVASRARIPINPDFDPESVISTDVAAGPALFDDMRLHIVGPTRANLNNLRQDWLEWLEQQDRRILVRDLDEARRAARAADTSVPNLSSIMILAEKNGKTVLLTGDGRGDHLLQGLEQAELLRPDGTLHVDVLKMPHHGSRYNVSKDFLRAVTADTYVMSASGKHRHPSIYTLRWLVEVAHDQGRTIEIFATNETKSTRTIVEEYDPADYGYRLVKMAPGADSAVLEVAP